MNTHTHTHTHTANIEPVRREHMTEVISLLQHMSSFQPPEDELDNIWDIFSKQNNVLSIVALINREVVGYGSVVIETKIRGGRMGHIEDIVTSPNYRKKGIGKSIVDNLYLIAKQHGCYKVALQCQEHNIGFYNKCNYDESGAAMQRFINSET